MNVCTKLCNECPFSKKSINGWLADYTVEDFQAFHRADAPFPCHMMTGDDMAIDEVEHAIRVGNLKLCRGYVESIIKSCKLPTNPLLVKAVTLVKEQGLSEDSMPIWEFKRHHEKLK